MGYASNNTKKLQEMVADHLDSAPVNPPKFMAFEDYTEREVAELPIRTKDQEQLIRRIVKQEVIKETIRTRKREIPGYEDAFEGVSKLIKEYHSWDSKQIQPTGDKAMNPNWDSYMYSPRWLVEIREQEEMKRRQPPQITPEK
jgi:hypothetical protein